MQSALVRLSLPATLMIGAAAGGQPLNDDCANATYIIGTGCFGFGTAGATTDGDPHPACASFDGEQVLADVWFIWEANIDGLALISTCGPFGCPSADFDTKIAVYQGNDCSNLTMLGCNDDGTGCPGYTSEVLVPVVAGNWYMIRVGGYSGATGSGWLLIDPIDAPGNDDCANARVISEGCAPFNTDTATTDGPSHFLCSWSSGQIDDDVWFRWTSAFTGTAQISLCGPDEACPGREFTARLAVYDGCDCSGLSSTLLACSTASVTCGSFGPEIMLPVQQGQCYLIRAGSDTDDVPDTGDGVLFIGQAPPPPSCPLECPPGEVTEPEPCGTNTNGCWDGATMTPIACGDVVCGTLAAEANIADLDFYEVSVSDPDGDGLTTIRATLTTQAPAILEISNGDSGICPGWPYPIVQEFVDPCGTATVTATVPAPMTYTVAVHAPFTDGLPCGGLYFGNDYQLRVACDPPPNDDCANAEFAVDGVVPFTTVGATTDGPSLPPACEEGYGLSFVNDVWFLWPAGCAGVATVSLCEADYDTRLAVYEADECPGALAACNDDACGANGLRSEVSFFTPPGAQYLIRVGGYAGTGTGLMTVTCEPEMPCPWDCQATPDGQVNIGDFLAMLAQWDQVGTSCDFDGGGVSVTDFLELLANWGDCP
jgi:hypothetical protein